MSFEPTPHRGFDIGKQLSIALCGVGGFLLLEHLGGQIREGSASGWSLILGTGCLIVGLVLALLFVILIRLHRIEQHITGSDNSEADVD